MPEKVESWEDYQAGYRQAIFDLTDQEKQPIRSSNGVFLAYLIGLIVGALVFKYTRE